MSSNLAMSSIIPTLLPQQGRNTVVEPVGHPVDPAVEPVEVRPSRTQAYRRWSRVI